MGNSPIDFFFKLILSIGHQCKPFKSTIITDEYLLMFLSTDGLDGFLVSFVYRTEE